MTAPATIETETAAQFISMALSTYGVPFQVLSPTPYPDKIGIRLHPRAILYRPRGSFPGLDVHHTAIP